MGMVTNKTDWSDESPGIARLQKCGGHMSHDEVTAAQMHNLARSSLGLEVGIRVVL